MLRLLYFCVIIAIVPTDDGSGGSRPKTTMILYRFLIIYLEVYFFFFPCVFLLKVQRGLVDHRVTSCRSRIAIRILSRSPLDSPKR
jgi:hypothetical protein